MFKKMGFALSVFCMLVFLGFLRPGPGFGAEKPFQFGLLLVGPYNDHGWSQAHFEAGEYVQKSSLV